MSRICKVCEKDENDIVFLKKGIWMGTKKLPEEFFRSSEFDFGWDYYPRYDLRQINCKCGHVWYEKVEG